MGAHLRREERLPVIGEVWFRVGKVPDQGTDAQRYAWAAAAPAGDLHCRIARLVEDPQGVQQVDYLGSKEVPADPPPAWMGVPIDGARFTATKRIDGTWRMPLDRFLLEWEPMTRERT